MLVEGFKVRAKAEKEVKETVGKLVLGVFG